MRGVTIIISFLILIAVLVPGSNLPDVDVVGFDKVVHMVMFFTWAIAVRWDLDRNPFPYVLVFIAGICFSVLTEILQILAEGRTFDFYDMLADILGLLIGLSISGPVTAWVRRLFS